MKSIFKFGILSLIVLAISSCVLVPVIDSVKKAGLTEGDRQALLGKRVKAFHESLYWGSTDDALLFVEDESKEDVAQKLDGIGDSEKVIETKVKTVNFEDNSFTAKVSLTVRSYKVPYYVVNDRHEKQTWIFSLTDGWKLKSLEVVKKKV